ncbi:MAG TPA: ABC transporter permease, partial [Mucilaginibacter sp.]|nr:ABC transporter permease [Mucilaginibacter sp.]
KLAIAPHCDTGNLVFKAIKGIPGVSLSKSLSGAEQEDALKKGLIAAVLNIRADNPQNHPPHYTLTLRASSSTGGGIDLLKTEINEAIHQIDQKMYPGNPSVATVSVTQTPGRVYRNIDFILPGQLGFSLLMAGVYGSSFLLFSLRKNLVLKRLRATPVKRRSIIAGEMLSRLFFHVAGFIVMVALGYYVFNFTLVNGIETFLEMLVFSLFGLFIFMGIGFIISGVVQNENSIAPIANTIVLPQILLCGLFFPIQNYPHWMEQFCSMLPLTLFVDGLRKIAFEGAHVWELPVTIGGLVLWNLIICPLSVRSFKWE